MLCGWTTSTVVLKTRAGVPGRGMGSASDERLVPPSAFHPYPQVRRDYFGGSVSSLAEYRALEEAIIASHPRFDTGRRGDVLGPVLLLEDEKPHGLALCGDGEVGICHAAAMRWGCEAGLAGRAGVSVRLGSGDQCLDESESAYSDRLGQAERLTFVLHGPDNGARPSEPRGHGDGDEDGKAPGGDVGQLDLVPVTAPASVQLLRLRNPSGFACGGDAGRPLLQVGTAAALDDPAACLRELL